MEKYISYSDMLETIYRYEFMMDTEKKSVSYNPEIGIYETELKNEAVKKLYMEIMEEKKKNDDLEKKEKSSYEIKSASLHTVQESGVVLSDVKIPEDEKIAVINNVSVYDTKIFVEKEKIGIRAMFSIKNAQEAIRQYANLDGKKALGYTYNNQSYYIMRGSNSNELSLCENSEPSDGEAEFLRKYYFSLFVDSVHMQEQKKLNEKQAKERELLRKKEEKINPKFARKYKNIQKMKRKNKMTVINDEDFKAFDFRGILIENTVFKNCDFTLADFSDVIVKNTLFVNCKMMEMRKDGLTYIESYMINCTTEKIPQ